MDREIPKDVQRREARKRWLKIGAVGGGVVGIVVLVIALVGESVKIGRASCRERV